MQLLGQENLQGYPVWAGIRDPRPIPLLLIPDEKLIPDFPAQRPEDVSDILSLDNRLCLSPDIGKKSGHKRKTLLFSYGEFGQYQRYLPYGGGPHAPCDETCGIREI